MNKLLFMNAKILFFAMFATLFLACNEDPVPPKLKPDLKILKLKFEKLVSGRKILRQQEILKQLQNEKSEKIATFQVLLFKEFLYLPQIINFKPYFYAKSHLF